ncbi:hypothetical protein PG984_015513 [Apiospora sp. TS-2023a]
MVKLNQGLDLLMDETAIHVLDDGQQPTQGLWILLRVHAKRNCLAPVAKHGEDVEVKVVTGLEEPFLQTLTVEIEQRQMEHQHERDAVFAPPLMCLQRLPHHAKPFALRYSPELLVYGYTLTEAAVLLKIRKHARRLSQV